MPGHCASLEHRDGCRQDCCVGQGAQLFAGLGLLSIVIPKCIGYAIQISSRIVSIS